MTRDDTLAWCLPVAPPPSSSPFPTPLPPLHCPRCRLVAQTHVAIPIGSWIACTPVDEIKVGIVRTCEPRGSPACFPRVVCPRVIAWFAFAGDGVGAPRELTGLGIVGVDESANAVFATGDARNDLVFDNKRRRGLRVAGFVVGNSDIPKQIASAGVYRDEVCV